MTEPTPFRRYPSRLVWRFVFFSYSILFAIAWWILPGGFPLSHVKFWCNQVACPGVALAMALGCYAELRGRETLLNPLATGAAMLSVAGGLSTAMLFSKSTLGIGIFLVALGGVLLILAVRTLDQARWFHRVSSIVGFGVIGTVLGLAQRGPEPSTSPALATLDAGIASRTPQPTWEFAGINLGTVTVDAPNERIRVDRGRYRLIMNPLLTFLSRSTDRGWTFFATNRDRRGPKRQFLAAEPTQLSFVAQYGPTEPARLSVAIAGADLETEGQVAFDQPVYSHLNAYAAVQLVGHTNLELEFSPCPGQTIEPQPHDYPVGRPLRMASLDGDGRFRVVEATSAEKGPYHTLAEGSLARGEPLTITLLEAGKPLLAITFDDWSAQVSTELSPTAGWGMPQNHVTFARHTSDPASVVSLELTLASTSAGRGFDSVGHAAGVYRNRMRMRWLP